MIITIPKNRSFLRTTMSATRGMLKGRKKPSQRVIFSAKELLYDLKSIKTSVQAEKTLKKPISQLAGKPDNKQPVREALKKPVIQSPVQPVVKPILAVSKKSLKRTSGLNWQKMLFVFFIISSIGLLIILFGPALYYKIAPADSVPLITTETGTPVGGRFDTGTQQRTVPLPPYDETLPEGKWLIIPRIGVRSEIQENENSQVALEKGVWRVPDFGVPGDLTKPMILAAHRYGYIWWWKNGSQYWRYNSFYLLPEVKQGDLVEVIFEKRKYVYEVYAGEEGTEITDYNADLILYTCKFLNGETRFFRYARLVDLSKDVQKTQ